MAPAPDDGGVLDLGTFDGPMLLFGGVYSNLQALQALLKTAEEEWQIPASNIVHTGDVVAYCGQPAESSDLLRASGAHCLMGNCEESIGTGKVDCGCGFPEDSACNRYSLNWYAFVSQKLEKRPELKEWMGSMPRRIEFRLSGRRFAVVHGSPRNISEFLWASTPDYELQGAMRELPEHVDAIVSGHSGIPFARLVPVPGGQRERLWINAGVIGMPANDGTPRGWYAVLLPVAGSLQVKIKALEYDAKGAADAVYNEPFLVRGYADALLSGVWPSHDVLPLEEQMTTGEPLAESELLWPAEEERRRQQGGAKAAAWQPGALLAATAAVVLASAALGWWLKPRRGGALAAACPLGGVCPLR